VKLLIKQPAGLGDIFFCQKISAQIAERKGASVIWPVLPHFMFIADYLRPIVRTQFVPVDKGFEHYGVYFSNFNIYASTPDCQAINLHGHTNDRGEVMKVKYEIVGLSWADWLDYFHFERNLAKEEALLRHLGIGDKDEFVFVNKKFASLPNWQEVSTIKVPEGARVVEMQIVDGFNIFDWCGVFERAKEIHTVETSICYVMERLKLTKSLFMYARNCAPSWQYIEGIYSKPWQYEN